VWRRSMLLLCLITAFSGTPLRSRKTEHENRDMANNPGPAPDSGPALRSVARPARPGRDRTVAIPTVADAPSWPRAIQLQIDLATCYFSTVVTFGP
jgi:hypothetical protein